MRTCFLVALCSVLLVPTLRGQAKDEQPIPVNNSLIAFTLPEKDLLPENIAYDPVAQAFYVGSTRKGKVVKIEADGTVSDFITPRQEGLWMVIGMKVDAERRVLWVNSSGGGNLIGYDRTDDRPAGVFKFDLRTGRLIKKYVIDRPGEVHFFNDLVLNDQGDAFITHMFDEAILYTIPHDTDELTVFARPEGFSFPNGITLSDDGRRLFVAHDEGISAFDVESRTRHPLASPEDLPLTGDVDGLYFYDNSLLAVHSGRNMVRRYYLDAAQERVVRAETIEAHHPLFMNPTTGVVVGDAFYYIANAQFDSFHEDGTLFPLERLFEVVVLKANL